MKRTLAPFLVTVFVAGGINYRPLYAQIGYTPRSVEGRTAAADVVAVATVADLTFQDRRPGPGDARSQWQWVTVTLKVRATLKGTAPETLVFVCERPRGDDTFVQWKGSGQSVLWFLEEIRDPKAALPPDFPALPKGQPRLRQCAQGAIVLGSATTGKRVPRPVLAMDFSVLAEEDRIIAAVKAEVARRHPSPARLLWIGMPYAVAARSGKAGDVNQLGVPVNARLEELARGWVGSKEAWLRAAGVQGLSHFQSEANAALLRGLLDDPASSVETRGGRAERVYFIREAAYQALRGWNVAAAQPRLREPLDKDR